MEKKRNRSRPISNMKQVSAPRHSMLAAALRVVVPYLILGAAWILFSDQILYIFTDNPHALIEVSTIKGWFFILITAIFLFVLVARELRRQAVLETELRKSLKEQNALLFELNHRVKNNLQVLASILNLEAEGIEGEEARDLNNRTKVRIRALSLAHERLFDAGDTASVDLGAYLRTLWTVIGETFEAMHAEASFSLEDIFAGPMEVPSFGLFATEAISNAILYGAGADGSCSVSIALYQAVDGMIELTIRDEGPGLAVGAEGLGLRLMDALADQLKGKLERYNDHGAVVRLLFPIISEGNNG
jgi:two-component sensor histidine kinase